MSSFELHIFSLIDADARSVDNIRIASHVMVLILTIVLHCGIICFGLISFITWQ